MTTSTPPVGTAYTTIATANGPQYQALSPTPTPTPAAPTAPSTYIDTTGKVQQNSPAPSSYSSPQTPLQPQSEDEVYSNYVTQGQSIIDQINAAAQAQIAAANQNIDVGASKEQGAAGLLSSGSVAASYSNAVGSDAASKKNTADTAISAQAAQNVSTYLQNLQSAAQGQANYEQTTAFSQGQTYDQYLKTTAATTLQGLAKEGVTVDSLANNQSPLAQQTYQTLLQAYGGDENALKAAAALATPVPTVVQSFTNGSTYNQVVRDPNTNAVSVQSFDLGMQIPTGWTSNKVSTNTLLMQDPNNPGNTVIYTANNPLTGDVQVTGTGTGTAIASQYKNTQSSGGSSSSSTPPANTGAGTASTTVSSILGVDPTTSFQEVVAGNGLGSLTAAMIQNEGGSSAGVVNNPGNVKYVGAPGQTDSGVKATDGGTFASYATPAAGQQAIASTLNSIAAKQQNPTLQSVVDTYTNTGSSSTQNGVGTNGLPTAEYGLLSNVQGFDPSGKNSSAPAGIDTAAMNYLKEYLTQGKTPTAASVGVSTRTGSGALFNTIEQRAADVYYQATGQAMPDLNTLNANKKLLTGNNSILNTLNLQEKTISANSDLLLKNLNGNNINQAAPVINGIIDSVKNSLGDPNVAQYLAQNATISNELGSLLALKNATGTTVHDKLESAGIIDKNDNADQIAAKVKVLMQEAENGRRAIGQASADLYQQIDPLGINPQNPANAPGYQELTSAGFTPNYDGTYEAPDGTTYKVDAQGNVTPQ